MTNEEIIKALKNFTEKQVNDLPEQARMVFYAIMNIADQRDNLKDRINKAIELLDPIDIDTYGDDNKDFKNRCAIDDAIKILKGEDK